MSVFTKIKNSLDSFVHIAADTPLTDTFLASKQGATSTAVAPAATQSLTVPDSESEDKEARIVSGTFVPAGSDGLFTESAEQTRQFAAVISSFDEDKQEPIEWAIWKCAAIFCYIAPFALSVPIGLSV